MTNATAQKFGYPRTRIAETDHWLVLLRPQQPTLGSLVLVCKSDARAFSDLSIDAFADLQAAVRGVEAVLRQEVDYARINYLMLMMVDPDVHFHVIPRYEGAREYEGRSFVDAGWPGVPALASHVALSDDEAETLARRYAALWPA